MDRPSLNAIGKTWETTHYLEERAGSWSELAELSRHHVKGPLVSGLLSLPAGLVFGRTFALCGPSYKNTVTFTPARALDCVAQWHGGVGAKMFVPTYLKTRQEIIVLCTVLYEQTRGCLFDLTPGFIHMAPLPIRRNYDLCTKSTWGFSGPTLRKQKACCMLLLSYLVHSTKYEPPVLHCTWFSRSLT